MSNLKSDAEVRDAIMLYITKVHKIQGQRLLFVVNYVYSAGLLKDLEGIRKKLKIESDSIYALEELEGVNPPVEDEDLLGHELTKLVDEYLLPSFYNENQII